MPVTYWIDEELNLLCHTWEGHISRREVIAFQSVAKGLAASDSLVDLSNMTSSEITPEDLRMFAQQRVDRRRMAIIAPKPARFGMARMFEALSELERNPTRVAVFTSREEAVLWLRGKANAAAQ